MDKSERDSIPNLLLFGSATLLIILAFTLLFYQKKVFRLYQEGREVACQSYCLSKSFYAPEYAGILLPNAGAPPGAPSSEMTCFCRMEDGSFLPFALKPLASPPSQEK